MGMTAVEKILARASGLKETRAGAIVYPTPDFVTIHDGVVMGAKQELDALGINLVFDPARVMMVTDHDVLYLSERAVARGAFNRTAAHAWGIKNFYDAGHGGQFCGKASAVIGTFLFGALSLATGSQRAAVVSVGLFFVAGLWLLRTVEDPFWARTRR